MRSNISHHFYEKNTPERFRFISSLYQMFFKIGVLKDFTNFTGKQLHWSLFLIKLQAFKAGALLKRDSMEISIETPTQVFSCEICEIFKNTSLYRTPPHSKITQALRISKGKSLIRHFLLRIDYTDVVMKVIDHLNLAKSCQINDTPTKVIKMNKDIFANFIADHFNYLLLMVNFLMN